MSTQRLSIIGVIIAIALALFAFTRQQQAATNEAAAVAHADAASASQAESEAERGTAVAQANAGGTAQAQAQQSEATAVMQANIQATAQADAQSAQASAIAQANTQATAQSEAESAQASAIAQANAAINAQAQAVSAQTHAEATRAAAVENAQAAATEAQNQAATATVAQGEAILQAQIAQSAVDMATNSAATASARQQSARATAAAIQGENAAIIQTATAQAGDLAITQTALIQFAGTLESALTPVARMNQTPEDTMRFLIDNRAIDTFGGHVDARLETSIDLKGRDNWNSWETFAGKYTDFVVSADIFWGGGAEEDQCGLMLRGQDNKNYYVLLFDRYGYLNLLRRIDGDWQHDFPFKPSRAIRTGKDDVNHVVMIVQKDEFLVYINDQPAGLYIDKTLSQGEVGLFATTYDHSDKAGCNFKNGWIWTLGNNAPTVTPISAPAVALAPTIMPAYAAPPLTQTYTYSNHSFSLLYPSNWITGEYKDGTMSLASSSKASDLTSGKGSGEIWLTIGTYPIEALQGLSFHELLTTVSDNTRDSFGSDTPIDFGEPELFQLGDYAAIRAIGKSNKFDIEIIVYGKDKGIVLIYAICGAGEMSHCEPTAYAIAETVIYHSSGDANENSFWNIS
ncbi:MAG: hypothetical protein ABI690_20460 [Chloroflexota bacterium]